MQDEFEPWEECICDNGKNCVKDDSGDKCTKKRVMLVAKKGDYGGKNDCEELKEEDDCTNYCKLILHLIISLSFVNFILYASNVFLTQLVSIFT